MRKIIFLILSLPIPFLLSGCGGYTNNSLYSDDVRTVYVEMFDNTTFRRDLEYDLTDAICKRIESETPYKIVSDRATADTILSGKIIGDSASALTIDRDTGKALSDLAEVTAQFSWKDLRTGQYLVQKEEATASYSYSEFQQQSFEYAAKVAANKLAERIVEQMQAPW